MGTILLVDDEESTLVFVRFALKQSAVPVDLHYVRDGIQAIRYLEGVGPYSDRKVNPIPDLMLLDLKMPLVDGFELLETIRAQKVYGYLPVVVLTESAYQPDIARALQLGANAVVIKEVDLTEFERSLNDTLGRVLLTPPPSADKVAPPLARAS